jgi:hypothetical protein
MNPFTRSLAERLIDALELYVNASRTPSGPIEPIEPAPPVAAPVPRALAWLVVDARRVLRKSAGADEVRDRTAAS